jgi:hypothetical protein
MDQHRCKTHPQDHFYQGYPARIPQIEQNGSSDHLPPVLVDKRNFTGQRFDWLAGKKTYL